jgi:hypothetical protein
MELDQRTDEMERIRPVASLTEYFKDSVAEAMQRQQIEADEHTSYYIVNLLTLFARSEALFDETEQGRELTPVARVLADAVECSDAERNFALQRVGDVSLFVAGFLGESLGRRLVDVTYYVQVGGSAYGALAAHVRGSARGRAFGSVFSELAEKFQDFVDVLTEIRNAAATSQQDIMRLYQQWLNTGSQRALRLLRAHGIQAVQPAAGETCH